MDTFPYESWDEAIAAAQENGEGYFTFGPGGNTGTIVLTVLGIAAMVISIAMFVMNERRTLAESAEQIRAEGRI